MSSGIVEQIERWEIARGQLEPVLTTEGAERWVEERRKWYGLTGELPTPDSLIPRLEQLKDKFVGERIFIIGNGPSLNRMDLGKLKYEYTFAANRFYLMYDRIDWTPSFYTATDWRVVPDTFMEINGLSGSLFFFDYRFFGLLNDRANVVWYDHSGARRQVRPKVRFSHDATLGVSGAGSVVGSAIQLAFHMGFDPIYLIGCDLGYKVPETVIQEGDDVFGTGVKLLLTSTKDDDSNHFDPRYFGAGKKWHDPNVKRMIEGHQACQAAITAAGRRILNATDGGELEVYPRVSYPSLFASSRVGRPVVIPPQGFLPRAAANLVSPRPMIGDFAFDQKTKLDECALVFAAVGGGRQRGVMLDVGAHSGTSLKRFSDAGWRVFAFEPDPNNRARLLRAVASAPNVLVSPEAVSDVAGVELPFYASEESSGISGLIAFRGSHREVAKVITTTLDDVISRHRLKEVDFLKIDVEGYEIAVLSGLDFDRLSPKVILAEYEDDKTRSLGYDAHDLCKMFVDRGYVVYVSEWHPIERYGASHSFRRLTRYPCPIPVESWGNLIAFRDEPSADVLNEAIRFALEENTDPGKLPSSSGGRSTVSVASSATKRPPKKPASTRAHAHSAGKAKRANKKGREESRPRKALTAMRSRQGFFQTWTFTIAAIGAALVLLVVAASLSTPEDSLRSLLLPTGVAVVALVTLAILHDSFNSRLNARRNEMQASTRALKARARRLEKSLSRKLKQARNSAARRHAAGRKDLGSVRAEMGALKTALDGQVAQVSSLENRSISLTRALGEQRATLNEAMSILGEQRVALSQAANRLDRLGDRDVSLDTVSALRALRGLIFPNAGGDTAGSPEHGHLDMMIAIANEFGAGGQSPSGRTLIEIGTTRERLDAQSSTEKLAVFTGLLGMRFVTVDMDPLNTARASRIIRQLNPSATAVTAKGEDYLAAAAGPFDYVYLDAFDFDHGKHSIARQNRYRENLGNNISDEACWEMHLECARHIAAKMRENGIVVIDDTWTDDEGAFAGKGKLAVPFLLDSGFLLVSRTTRTVTLRREQG